MDPITFSKLIRSELEIQRASQYVFWRTFRSSATQRAIALLDLPPPSNVPIFSLHDEAIEAIITGSLADDERKQAPYSAALREWNESSHQPWRFGVETGEWNFKGGHEKKELGKVLLRLRKNLDDTAPNARPLLDYYASVSDTELETALNWMPARPHIFEEALSDQLSAMHVKVARLSGFQEKRFLIRAGSSELELALTFQRGTIAYNIFRFFGNPQMSACYEAFFGIGIGEWDLVTRDLEEKPAGLFAEFLHRLLVWNEELRLADK
jgi:hypothetical protein